MRVLLEGWRKFVNKAKKPANLAEAEGWEYRDPLKYGGSGEEHWQHTDASSGYDYETKLSDEEDDSEEVSKVIIFNKEGQFLLLKRADGNQDWDLPGGHVKIGENIATGGQREVKEETNLEVGQLQPVNKHKNVAYFKTDKYSGTIDLDLEENLKHEWVGIDELDRFPGLFPDQKKAIYLATQQLEEDYQSSVKKRHQKLKKKNIGLGGNKSKNPPYVKKPSYERSKTSPPGFQGT